VSADRSQLIEDRSRLLEDKAKLFSDKAKLEQGKARSERVVDPDVPVSSDDALVLWGMILAELRVQTAPVASVGDTMSRFCAWVKACCYVFVLVYHTTCLGVCKMSCCKPCTSLCQASDT
jgi:hypothetical protein